MVVVNFTLHNDDGGLQDEERRCEQVPRVGEMISFDFNHSYQVVDVLWHLNQPAAATVTVTACEVNWHKHIDDVVGAWHKSIKNS